METWNLAGIASTSLVTAALIVVTQRWHGRWTGDFEDSGVQKHHAGSPPRVGILAILAGVLIGAYFLGQLGTESAEQTRHVLMWLLVSSLPVVLLGLADDLTKRITPLVRLLGACAAGLAAAALLGTYVIRVNIPLLDELMLFTPLAVAVTILMVAGFSNAMNIVDGLNGLSSGLAMLMLVATAVAAAAVEDQMVFEICSILALAVLGFALVNFPRGLLFLGDGGAYFLGFALVQVWLLLLARNTEISTWFVVALAAHPTMETLFSMYRRRIYGRLSGAFTAADRLHLHSLVYRRRALPMLRSMPWAEKWVANAVASCLILMFGLLPILAASLAPHSTAWCVTVIFIYVVAYVAWFKRLVNFGHSRSSAGLADADTGTDSKPASSAAS